MSIDYVASYSLTKPYEGSQISKFIIDKINNVLKKDSFNCIVTDGTAGSGGDSINFSNNFEKVNSVEINKEMYYILANNTRHKNNIALYNDDYTKIYNRLIQDVIYLDPPWGGTEYKYKKDIVLELSGIPLSLFIKNISRHCKETLVFIKAPLNINTTGICISDQIIIYNKSKMPSFKLIFVGN